MIKNLLSLSILSIAFIGIVSVGAGAILTEGPVEQTLDCDSPIPSGEIGLPPERPEGYCPDAPGYVRDFECELNCLINYYACVQEVRDRLNQEHSEVCEEFQKAFSQSWKDYLDCLSGGGDPEACETLYDNLTYSFGQGYFDYRGGLFHQYNAEVRDCVQSYHSCMESCCIYIEEL